MTRATQKQELAQATICIADPPYPGQSKKHYGDHPDYAGEVDHDHLISGLQDYDGWALHTSSPALAEVLTFVEAYHSDYRVMSWCKSFAAFKRNVPVAYAWEPVIVKPARTPKVGGMTKPLRDFIVEPITMKRGLSGAKPENVCWWLFEVIGAQPTDNLTDMFPGSGAVQRAWDSWGAQLQMEVGA